MNGKQLAGKSMDQFYFSLLDLAAKPYPSHSQGNRDAAVCQRFSIGLADDSPWVKFLYKSPK